jgi:outer membrane protein assembly factor BamB
MKPSLAIALFFLCLPAVSAGDWPSWRGPTGQGVADDKGLPLEWDAKSGKNVLWKAELPGNDGKSRQDQNQSSPVVVKGKVFLTLSYWPKGVDSKEFPEHHVLCFDAATGKQLWDVKVAHGPWSRASDLRGGYTVPTPAADAERVVVCFGSSVLACLDHKGKQLWRKEITPYQFDVTMGSSPVLYKGTVIMQFDGVTRTSRMAAFDLKTGDEKWSVKRPTVGFSHSTPTLATVGKKTQLLVAASNAIQGVDPDDGKVLWWCQSSGDTASPVMAGGLVYCDSGRGGLGACVDPTGEGDVTKTHRKWKIDRVPEAFSSPVVVSGRLYRLMNSGVLQSWKMSDGEEGEKVRLSGVSSWVSPFTTPEGRIYCASAGKSVVLEAGEKPKVLATNDLGDGSNASPAVAGGRIYLKGRKYLWCIGGKEEKKR